MANAFQKLILPRGTAGVFGPQPSGADVGVPQQVYYPTPISGSTASSGFTSMVSGGGASISSGILPSQNSINGTYYYPVGLSQTELSTSPQGLPPAQPSKPTSAGSYPSSLQDAKLTTTTPTPSASQPPNPNSATTYSPIASVTTPPPLRVLPSVAPDRNTSDPQNVVPNSQVGLDYGEIGTSDPTKAGRAASVKVEFHLPAVVLEHIDSISSVTCPSSDKLLVVYSQIDPFRQAINHWPQSELNLINYADGCGDDPNQRGVFQASRFAWTEANLTIEVTGRMLSLNDPGIISNWVASFNHQTSAQANPSSVTTQAPQVKKIRGVLGKLGGEITSKADFVGNKVTSAVSSADSHAKSETSHVGSEASSVATDAHQAASDLTSEAKKGFSKGATSTFRLDVGPKPTQETLSPFGQADKLVTIEGVTIWCVECGANGNIDVSGEIGAGVDGISSGSLNFQALDFHIPLTFGFEAKNAVISKTLSHTLFEIPLTPFEVEPFFSIGPKFTFGVAFTVSVGATGNLKVGANMHWGNASATMDLVKKDPKTLQMTGWTPDVEKVFEFSGGQVAVNATLDIPMSFDIGLSLLQHPVSKNVSITDTPSVQLDSIFHVPGKTRRDHPRDLVVRDDTCSHGVDEIIAFKNVVDVNVIGLWKTEIESFSTPLWSTCITNPTHSSSASLFSGSSSPSLVPAMTTTSNSHSLLYTDLGSKFSALLSLQSAAHPTGGTGTASQLPNNANSTGLAAHASGVSLGTSPQLPTQGPTGIVWTGATSQSGFFPSVKGASSHSKILPPATGAYPGTTSHPPTQDPSGAFRPGASGQSGISASAPAASLGPYPLPSSQTSTGAIGTAPADRSEVPTSATTPTQDPPAPTVQSRMDPSAAGTLASTGLSGTAPPTNPAAKKRQYHGLENVVREIEIREAIGLGI